MNDNTTTVTLQINGKEAETSLQTLRKRAEELRDSLVRAMRDGDEKGIKSLRREIRDTDRQIKQMQSSTANAERVLKSLDKAAPRDLQEALRILTRQLQSIERGSEAWKVQVEKIKRVKAELDTVNAELKQSESFFTRMRNTVNNWGASIAAGAGAVTGLVMAGKKAVNTYAEMQQEEANVRKYTGMTEEQVNRLNDAFKQMDTRTGRDELNRLAQEAGRLGKQSEEDVLGFVKAADKINVALDDLGEGATLTLSKLTTIFGDEERLGTEKALLSVGSVINELSQNCTASAPYLAEFAQRLAGVGAQAGMTIPEIMGFGAVLDSQGQKVEMSATALSKVIMSLFKNPEKIAKATGMAVEEFSETCKRSTNEGLLMLLDRLHELGGIDSLAPVFADMGENGARASAVLAALAGNIDTVRAQQEAANVAFREATSIDKEFAVQNTTVQAGLEKARKGFTEMAVTLGQELMPIVSKLISSTSMTMRVMLKTIQFIKEYRGYIIATAAAVAGYTVVVKGAAVVEAGWNTIKKIGTAIQLAWNAAMTANPIGLFVAGLSAAAVALAAFVRKQRESVKEANKMTEAEKLQVKVTATLKEHEKSIEEEYAKQAGTVRGLTKIVDNNNISLNERRKALEKLKEIVPGYHATLTEEGTLINNNKAALEDYLVALKNTIRTKMNQEKLEEIAAKQIPLEDSIRKLEEESERLQGVIDDARKTGNDAAARDMANIVAKNNQTIRRLKRQWQELEDAANAIGRQPVTTGGGTVPTGGGDAEEEQRKNEHEAALKEVEEWKKKEQAIINLAYVTGEDTFSVHNARMRELEKEYHERRLALMEEGTTEYWQEQASYEKKLRADNNAKSLKEQQSFYEYEKRCLDERYMNNEITYKQYTRSLEEAELVHLNNIVRLYEAGSEEYIKAQEDLRKKEHEIQKKRFDEYKKIQEQLKKAYFGTTSGTSDKESYDEEMMQLEAVKSQLLLMADSEQKKLEIYRAYREARFQIAKKYNMDAAMDAENSFRASMEKIAAWLESDYGKAFTKSFSTLVDGMGQIFSGLSDLIDAETDLQTADIERRYQAEIDAAGNNKAQVTALEKKKEEEIAKVKNEAEEKKYGMQVAQAVAQTALSAINAFSSAAAIPLVGFIMAPIAAAMAVAAGAVQIAALKKQRDAALAQGYAAGGYTMPGSKYQPAGIVHAGEWVASQELLANPTAAATIAQLDEAQRTNTIGQLNRPAPTFAGGTSGHEQQTGTIVHPESGSDTRHITDTLDRLNKTLDNGIYAATLLTGDKGIIRQQKKYDQLMKNKSGL